MLDSELKMRDSAVIDTTFCGTPEITDHLGYTASAPTKSRGFYEKIQMDPLRRSANQRGDEKLPTSQIDPTMKYFFVNTRLLMLIHRQ
jgi:hypothetical protein